MLIINDGTANVEDSRIEKACRFLCGSWGEIQDEDTLWYINRESGDNCLPFAVVSTDSWDTALGNLGRKHIQDLWEQAFLELFAKMDDNIGLFAPTLIGIRVMSGDRALVRSVHKLQWSDIPAKKEGDN